eukprot:TRINITY_DN483773_c1_g1_i1.p1 TRINITY_DN483773_c1_g1~~TRINITY_DN483773_c1_g1_i1.p1  ORF type:complete len:214 (-),score=40.89 TRINITY_DN483773_c1_g1_i1:159-800(-)
MQNKKVVVFSIIILLGAFFIGGYYYKNYKQSNASSVSKEQLALLYKPYSVKIGSDNAKVKLVEFFDPACGTCAYFYPRVEKLMEEKKGDIQLILRYAPFHKNSTYAVKMLEGARAQGLFVPALELMFQTQRQWVQNHTVNPQLLWRVLYNVEGLDMEKLGEFMNATTADDIIKQDMADVETLKVDKTPSYFVNGEPLVVFGWENLVELIDSHL